MIDTNSDTWKEVEQVCVNYLNKARAKVERPSAVRDGEDLGHLRGQSFLAQVILNLPNAQRLDMENEE